MYNIKNARLTYTDVGDVIIHAFVRLNQIQPKHQPMKIPYTLQRRTEHIEHSIVRYKAFPFLTCVMRDDYFEGSLKIS